MKASSSRYLNMTKAYKTRQKIGTLCIKIKDAADCLEEESDERRWKNLERLLHELQDDVWSALCYLDDPKNIS
jgi:hypothetical protein